MKLQLLRMDFPDASPAVGEVLETLDHAMERVRALSQELNPSPVYRVGFKTALTNLVETYEERFPGKVSFTFSRPARLREDTAAAMYEAGAATLETTAQYATRIGVSVRGDRLRIQYHGGLRRPPRSFAIIALVAQHAGLTFDVSTGKGTIVSIGNALRRSPRR
jgi:signal transduction histidine kinase